MCLAGRTALVSGVGERLQPAPALPPCAILLVNPGIALPTRDVFTARRGAFSTAVPVTRPWRDLADFVATLPSAATISARGDRAAPGDRRRAVFPAQRADGAHYAAMSGSGATCFALYDSADARAAGERVDAARLVAPCRDVDLVSRRPPLAFPRHALAACQRPVRSNCLQRAGRSLVRKTHDAPLKRGGYSARRARPAAI